MNVIPIVTVHNPDENLEKVVSGLVEAKFKEIIVVNVDSDQSRNKYFEALGKYENCKILYNLPDKGRGRALKIAFKYILDNKMKAAGIVTVNGYNQFNMDDIVLCAREMVRKKDSLVFASRDLRKKEFPLRTRIGNFLMKGVCRFACGCSLSDPLTGLRAIPYKYLEGMCRVKGDKYDYDTNLILYTKENGIAITEVKIDSVYLEKKIEEHYKPILDAIRISSSIFKFILSSVVSSGLDQFVYLIMIALLSSYDIRPALGIFIATVVGRAISSLVNFTFNRRAVFKSDNPVGKTMAKYYTLCVTQMTISYFLVYIISHHLSVMGAFTVFIKLCVDICLFLIGFQIQRRWVFKNA